MLQLLGNCLTKYSIEMNMKDTPTYSNDDRESKWYLK